MQLLKLLALAVLATAAVLPASRIPSAAIAERDALPAGVSLTCAHDLDSSKYLMADNLNDFLLAHSGNSIPAHSFVSDTFFLPYRSVDLILRNTCDTDAVPTFDEAYKNFQQILSCTSSTGRTYGGKITVSGWCFQAEYNVSPKLAPISARAADKPVPPTVVYPVCAAGSRGGDIARQKQFVWDFCMWVEKNGMEAHTIRWVVFTDGNVQTTISLTYHGDRHTSSIVHLDCDSAFDHIDEYCDSGAGTLHVAWQDWAIVKKLV